MIDWNEKYIKTDFDSSQFYYGKYNQPSGCIYEGMIDKKYNLPTGFGRYIWKDNLGFSDGQWRNDKWHGYVRDIY